MIVYFLSETKPNDVNQTLLDSLGLSYAFDPKSPRAIGQVRSEGPDGKGGAIVGRENSVVEYAPDLQTWTQSKTNEAVWIGYPKTIDPLDLVRTTWKGRPLCVESNPIKDTSGREWPIPIARAWSTNSLPRGVQWDGEQFLVGDVLPQFTRLEEIGSAVIDHYATNEWPDDYMQLCAEIVSQAYYLGPQEFADLGLVTTDPLTSLAIFEALIDTPAMNARSKKNNLGSHDDSKRGSED